MPEPRPICVRGCEKFEVYFQKHPNGDVVYPERCVFCGKVNSWVRERDIEDVWLLPESPHPFF